MAPCTSCSVQFHYTLQDLSWSATNDLHTNCVTRRYSHPVHTRAPRFYTTHFHTRINFQSMSPPPFSQFSPFLTFPSQNLPAILAVLAHLTFHSMTITPLPWTLVNHDEDHSKCLSVCCTACFTFISFCSLSRITWRLPNLETIVLALSLQLNSVLLLIWAFGAETGLPPLCQLRFFPSQK